MASGRAQDFSMSKRPPRLAVRALILDDQNRLLLVNAFAGNRSDLWCAPGGGVQAGKSLPDNLAREVHEETGLVIEVGQLALVNEFHDPATGFHQVELFFRAKVVSGVIDPAWQDPEHVVSRRAFFGRLQLETGAVRFKPDSLAHAPWVEGCLYDPLELFQR
jgi:8-oxo-dGTP diphosphatase